MRAIVVDVVFEMGCVGDGWKLLLWRERWLGDGEVRVKKHGVEGRRQVHSDCAS